MSTFSKKFLQDEIKGGPRAFLAAFGKHPGWNDHIDDLGIETDTLVMAKNTIYLEGLNSQIDAGAWEKLEPENRIEGFDHLLLWQRGANCLLATMISSRDGKGRTRYPMILCAQFNGVPLGRVLREMRPLLDGAMEACRTTTSAEDVRRIVTEAREALRAAVARAAVDPAAGDPPAETLGGQDALGPDNEGLLRILYQIQNQFSIWAPRGSPPKRMDDTVASSSHLRVPQVFGDSVSGLLAWCRFLAPHFDDAAPRLFVWPRAATWLDVMLGEPAGADFFCLRANERSIPGANVVPYELDELFRQTARALIEQQKKAATKTGSILARAPDAMTRPVAAATTAVGPAVPPPPGRRLRWPVLVAVAGCVVVALIFAVLWFSSPSVPAPERTPAQNDPPPTPAPLVPETAAPVRTAVPPGPVAAARVTFEGGVGEAWAKLCRDFYEWIGPLQAALKDRGLRARWERDAYLKTNVMERLAQAHTDLSDFDPRAIADVKGQLQSLAGSPPSALANPAVNDKVIAAAQAAQALAQALYDWPALAQMHASRAQLLALGWTKPLDGPEIPDALPYSDRLAPTIDYVLGTPDTITPVAQLAGVVMDEIRQAREAGDPAAAAAAAAIQGKVLGVSALSEIQRELTEAHAALQPTVALMAGDWQSGRIDRERFLRERGDAWGRDLNGAALLTVWIREASDYTTLAEAEIPLPESTWEPSATRARELIEQLAALTAPAEAEPLRQRLADLNGERDAMRGRSLVRKDLPAREKVAALLASRMERLVSDLTSEVGRRVDSVGWLQQIRAVRIAESAVVDTEWGRRRDALLETWDLANAAQEIPRFVEFQGRMDRIEKFLRGLATHGPLQVTITAGDGLVPAVAGELQQAAGQRRELVLAKLLESVTWEHAAPTQSAENFLQADPPRAVVAAFATSIRSLVDFGKTLGRTQARLEQGAAWQDGLAATFQSCSDFLASAPDVATLPGVAEITARFAALASLASATDRAALVAAGNSAEWSQAVTAWRRLGELKDWPNGGAEWEDERKIGDKLLANLPAAISDTNGRAQFQARVVTERKRRWQQALDAAVVDADTERLLASREAAGVSAQELSQKQQANLLLSQLRVKSWGTMNDQQGRQERDAAVAKLQSVAPSDPVRVAALVEQLTQVSFEKGAVDYARQGPGIEGWTLENPADATHLTYAWKSSGGRAHRIEFVLLPGAGEAAYLGVTELPVQLFLDWVGEKDLWTKTLEAQKLLLDDFENGDPRRGPRSYFVTDDKAAGAMRFTPASMYWLPPGLNLYPPDGAPPRPTEYTPLNYVSYTTARLFCASLRCRLPRDSEWSEAVKTATGSGNTAPVPNVRDSRWVRQLEFERKQKAPCWPDEDVFFPVGRGREIAAKENAKGVTDGDDGFLWFADVGTGAPARFRHLTGNVAEFVTDSDGAVGVIGGSALSPPELAPDHVYLVDKPNATRGFSDVGFRLAFSIERLSGAAEVQRLLVASGFFR